jgi:hypothetical protein
LTLLACGFFGAGRPAAVLTLPAHQAWRISLSQIQRIISTTFMFEFYMGAFFSSAQQQSHF